MRYLIKPNLFCQKRLFSTESNVRVRFAPSPTGFLHLGGLRTAFYNYLFSKRRNGKYILRIEDTDQDRVTAGSVENLEESLTWAGINIDEGPSAGGNYGPYFQSQRLSYYQERAYQLIETSHAYRCFCSHIRLDLLKKQAAKNREIPRYDNRCRNLTKKEIDQKLSEQIPYTIRLKLKEGPVEFHDLVFGNIAIDLSKIESDPIILKSDGFPTYHLANVVDDHLMNVSHVLRGVEWQVSTPKHLMMYEAFQWKPPIFAHLPLILNTNNSKLSKRQDDIRVDTLRQKGFYSKAILNYLSTIGGGFEQTHTKISDEILKENQELASIFDLDFVKTKSNKIDWDKFRMYNKTFINNYITESPNLALQDVKSIMKQRHDISSFSNFDDEHLLFILNRCKDRLITFYDLFESDEFSFLWSIPALNWKLEGFHDDSLDILKAVYRVLNEDTSHFNLNNLERSVNEIRQASGLSKKDFMKIFRVSLTSSKSGPPVVEVMEMLGRKKTLLYLSQAIEYAEKLAMNRINKHN